MANCITPAQRDVMLQFFTFNPTFLTSPLPMEMKIQLKDAVNELGGEKGVDQVVTSWRDWRKRVVNRFRENSSRIFSDQDQRLLSLLQKHRALIPAPVSDPTAIRLSGSKQVNQHSSIGSLGSNTNLTSQGIKIPANSAKGTLQKPSIQNLAVFSAGSSSRKSVPQSQLSSQFPHPTSTITCPAQMNESQKNGQPPINTGSIDSSGFHSTFELQSLLKETDDHNNETLNLRDSLFSHVDHLKNTSGISGQSDKFLIYDDLEPTDLAKLDASHSSKIINQEKTNKRTVKPETMYLTFLKGKEEENNKYKKMKLELEREKLELKREKLGISKKKLALKEEKLQILKDEKCQDAQYLQRIEKLLEDAHNY